MAMTRSVIQAALTALPPPVSTSAMTGIPTAWAMFQERSRTSFIRTSPTSGLAEEGPGQAVAGDLDGLEAALLDDLGAQGVVTAGDDDGPPVHDGLSENTRLFHD